MRIKIAYSKEVVKSIEKYKLVTFDEIEDLIRKFVLKFFRGRIST